MPVERSQIESFLDEIHLFSLLDDQQISWVARQFDEIHLKSGEILFSEGESGDSFFIILEGEVTVCRRVEDGEDVQLDILFPGDFFGEEALLFDQPRSATITAVMPVRLLCLDRDRFDHLISEFPQIKSSLLRVVESRRFAHKHKFDWLNKDEVIYQVRRKHVAYLVLVLLLPSLICLFAFAAFLFGVLNYSDVFIRNISLVFGGVVALVGLGWGVWSWIDWGNDHYIITSQRVVWIERVIWLYESQSEAPLSTITAVNVTASFWGRLLGYGDVVVTTYVGKVPLRVVGEPYQMAALVEEHWHRAQRSYQRSQQDELEKAIRRIIEPEGEQASIEPKPDLQDEAWTYKELNPWQKYFGNVFKMRFEQGNIITYRKHWIILVRKTLKPLVTGMLILLGITLYTTFFALDYIKFFPPTCVDSIGILLLIIVILPWWLYNYVDWRNDIYQITEESVFDIERKPFGTEVKKSASLGNILSLEHERPGFLGYLLNVGSVMINVGDSKLDFIGVHEPARIQQDIFTRMHMLRIKKEKAEIGRERDRILALLEIYHRDIENYRQED